MRRTLGLIVGLGTLAQAPLGAQTPASFEPHPLTPFQVAKVEWLLRERLPCLGCHRLGNEGGLIGPDLRTVGGRRSASSVYAMITDPDREWPGARMPRIPMPAEWAGLLANYLASGGGQVGRAPAPSRIRLREDAAPAQLYAELCAGCHGETGGGDGFNAANLPVRPTAHSDSAYMSTRPDDTLFDGIYAGGYILNRSARMPPFGQMLSREQVWGLVRYLRQLCRCEGPQWSRP